MVPIEIQRICSHCSSYVFKLNKLSAELLEEINLTTSRTYVCDFGKTLISKVCGFGKKTVVLSHRQLEYANLVK